MSPYTLLMNLCCAVPTQHAVACSSRGLHRDVLQILKFKDKVRATEIRRKVFLGIRTLDARACPATTASARGERQDDPLRRGPSLPIAKGVKTISSMHLLHEAS